MEASTFILIVLGIPFAIIGLVSVVAYALVVIKLLKEFYEEW